MLLASCGLSDTEHEFFPLSDSIHWQYRVERKTMDGASDLRYAISTRLHDSVEGPVTAVRETIGGHRYYYHLDAHAVYRIGERPPGMREISYYAIRQMVLPRVLKPSHKWGGMTRTAVLESTGPPWETLFRIDVPVVMQYRVESLVETIETPAGKFTGCLMVSGYGKTDADIGNTIGRTKIEVTTKEWFAPRVGLVRMERSERTDTEALDFGELTMELDNWRNN